MGLAGPANGQREGTTNPKLKFTTSAPTSVEQWTDQMLVMLVNKRSGVDKGSLSPLLTAQRLPSISVGQDHYVCGV